MPNITTTPSTTEASVMAKIRIVDGLQLPDNLYTTPRKEAGKWRYKRPDGSFYTFAASTVDAIEAAKGLNAQFSAGAKVVPIANPQYGRLTIRRHVEDFILEREKREPSLIKKTSWYNRTSYLRQFATLNAGKSVSQLTLLDIQEWWDELTGHAQRSRQPEFRRFFNHLLARSLCPKLDANPFSSSDAAPRVEMSAKPPKERLRLTQDEFWLIHNKAGEMNYPFLQVAMGISLITTLRRGDICDLKFDEHIVGNLMRKRINKSHAQLSKNFELKGGRADPANLSWSMDKHPLLRQLIKQARELSMAHQRCPSILSHKYKRRYKSQHRSHPFQVLPKFVSDTFADVRDATTDQNGKLIFEGIRAKNRPTFHEVRSLAGDIYSNSGYSKDQIRELYAHTDENTTAIYLSGHGEKWQEIGIVMSADALGGKF